ncbi:endolytic transglycosylase MltG [Granulicatella sp.]
MSKTKFRSLGVAFLLSAIILALTTVAWPFVPDSLKNQLDSVHLPLVTDTVKTTEETTVATTVAAKTTESTTKETAKVADKPVSITVESGEVSSDVARKLKEAGVITDSKAFVDYLLENNIAENILAGTFEIKPNSSFEEIARTLGALR